MTGSRVIFRVEPERNEDVFGYLARVASRNQLGNIHTVLSEVLGVKQAEITTADAAPLAHFCRLHLDEMLSLSGVSRKTCYGARTWQVCGQWVSKEPFVATRRARVCPACLRDAAYIRGEWMLSFYTSCIHHSTALVGHCPCCKKSIRWNRHLARYCACGGDLAITDGAPASPHGLMVSELIGWQSGYDIQLRPYPGIGILEHEQLARLSLDGLCKTMWFLGHCLGELGRYSVGHGRIKPMSADADAIVLKALQAIEDWPRRFGELLNTAQHPASSARAGTLIERLLGPVHKYFLQEMQDEELSFVRIAYEQHVHDIWRRLGRRRQTNDRQLELDFDP
ncbi:TniQ family protein [Uliginosibacterium sediminicola]|uniref:TniQ family protein n=1 Tax=Uliginosibacterium sediminicola TaxID=2024550 RepID=UPI003D0EF0F8